MITQTLQVLIVEVILAIKHREHLLIEGVEEVVHEIIEVDLKYGVEERYEKNCDGKQRMRRLGGGSI